MSLLGADSVRLAPDLRRAALPKNVSANCGN
jgi:hypothetical protein